MPEGHVIHGLARDLGAAFAGRAVAVSSPQGRFGASAAVLDGTELVDAEAAGKHLFIGFDAPTPTPVIQVHLGLIGKLWIRPPGPVAGQVRLRIASPERVAELHGPQLCRLISPQDKDAVIAGLGADPLRADADPERAWARIQRSGRPVAALLMDQRVSAGVGNIYRAEVLFRQRVDPFCPGQRLRAASWLRIWTDLVELMALGLANGRIDTVRPQDSPEATGRPPRVDPHGGEVYVYRRAGQRCLVCGGPVRTTLLESRNLYWCPRCQRRH